MSLNSEQRAATIREFQENMSRLGLTAERRQGFWRQRQQSGANHHPQVGRAGVSANLDLARRQQRIPVALLAERAGLSMPTVTKMLRTGNGSFENFLRIARLLGLLDGVQQATDPLNTDIGKLRADEDTPKRIR